MVYLITLLLIGFFSVIHYEEYRTYAGVAMVRNGNPETFKHDRLIRGFIARAMMFNILSDIPLIVASMSLFMKEDGYVLIVPAFVAFVVLRIFLSFLGSFFLRRPMMNRHMTVEEQDALKRMEENINIHI
jgi:hypothetical protein